MLTNKLLAYILIVVGIIESFGLFLFTTTMSRLSGMYAEMNVKLPSSTNLLLQSVTLTKVIGVIYLALQFYVVYKLVAKSSKTQIFNKAGKIFLLVGLALATLIVPTIIISIILPIYKLTADF